MLPLQEKLDEIYNIVYSIRPNIIDYEKKKEKLFGETNTDDIFDDGIEFGRRELADEIKNILNKE